MRSRTSLRSPPHPEQKLHNLRLLATHQAGATDRPKQKTRDISQIADFNEEEKTRRRMVSRSVESISTPVDDLDWSSLAAAYACYPVVFDGAFLTDNSASQLLPLTKDGHWYVTVTRNEDDRHVDPIAGDAFLQIQTIEAWKRNVKYEAGRNATRNKDSWAAEKFLCGREYFRLPAFAANQQLQRLAYGHVVVNHEHDWCLLVRRLRI
jgi:hypothetical protein